MPGKKIQLLCVDFQGDFTDSNNAHYKPRPAIRFIKDTLVPFLRDQGLYTAEIISDYRQPPGQKLRLMPAWNRRLLVGNPCGCKKDACLDQGR